MSSPVPGASRCRGDAHVGVRCLGDSCRSRVCIRCRARCPATRVAANDHVGVRRRGDSCRPPTWVFAVEPGARRLALPRRRPRGYSLSRRLVSPRVGIRCRADWCRPRAMPTWVFRCRRRLVSPTHVGIRCRARCRASRCRSDAHVGIRCRGDSSRPAWVFAVERVPGTSRCRGDAHLWRHRLRPRGRRVLPMRHETVHAPQTSLSARHETSPMRHETSPMRHETSPMRHETSPMRHETSPMRHETSPMRHRASSARRTMSRVRCNDGIARTCDANYVLQAISLFIFWLTHLASTRAARPTSARSFTTTCDRTRIARAFCSPTFLVDKTLDRAAARESSSRKLAW
jgi:hypothetical protein